jgi:hypothetical protein
MKIQYEVCTIESERGWGQKREYALFDTYQEAAAYRDKINSYNTEDFAPDWYMIAEKEIRVKETQ